MELTDRIRNKWFDEPLDTQLWKTYYEYTALATLRFCYGDMYQHLHHADAPDLQDLVHSVGIEVVNSISAAEAQAEGEMLKYPTLRTEKQKAKSKKKIEEYMDDFDEYGTLYPDRFLGHEWKEMTSAFQHKLKKVAKYQENGFEKLGLLIYHPQFIFPETEEKFAAWLVDAAKDSDAQDAQFDFVYILPQYSRCNSGILYYDFISGEAGSVKVSHEDMRALHTLGRMTAEGEIKEDDPEWI